MVVPSAAMRPSPSPAERAPLPTDAAGLPSLGSDADQALADGLRAMAIDLPPAVLEAIDAHARLLAAWGRHVNLTAIREPVEVIRLHVLDSLSAVAAGPCPDGGRCASVVDIGSGGGYPGLPVGAGAGCRADQPRGLGRSQGALPRRRGRRDRAQPSRASGRIDVEVLPVRAEELAAGDRRASWDVATVRAVGSVAECAELGLPLLRHGGLLVCWKRRRRSSPMAEVAVTRGDQLVDRRLAWGGTPDVVAAGVPGSPAHRLVLVRKERPTPGSYPRPPAARRGPADATR